MPPHIATHASGLGAGHQQEAMWWELKELRVHKVSWLSSAWCLHLCMPPPSELLNNVFFKRTHKTYS